MFKRIIIIILFATFLFQVNSYSLISYRNRSYLAHPSLFNKVKTIIQNDDYHLMKLNDEHFIYIDNSGNFIEFLKIQQEWQAKYNGHRDYPTGIINYIIDLYLKVELKPEEVIIKEFRRVLAEFEGSALSEVNEFEKMIQEVLKNIIRIKERIAKDDFLFNKSEYIKTYINIYMESFSNLIIQFLCSQKLEVQLLGQQLQVKLHLLYKNSVHFKSFLEYRRVSFSDFYKEDVQLTSLQTRDMEVLRLVNDMCALIDIDLMLLQKSLIKQIVIPTLEGTQFKYVLIKEFKQGDLWTKVWEISSQNKELARCFFNNKEKGNQFGVIMTVKNYEKNTSRKYFVKAHIGYALTETVNEIYAQGFHQHDASYFPKKPDLTEIFVYKILEKLGMGPRVQFMIHPYARSGLFIISEALLDFKEASQLQENEVLMKMFKQRMEIKGLKSFKIGINQIDLLSRIFNLSDIHSDNFGIVSNRNKDNPGWKILDFTMRGSIKYGFDNHYHDLSNAFVGYTAMDTHTEDLLTLFLPIINKRKHEKIQIGIQVMKNLENKRNFYKHLEESFNEILNYIQEVIPGNEKTIVEFLGMDIREERRLLTRYVEQSKRIFKSTYIGLKEKNELESANKIEKIIREFLADKEIKLSVVETVGEPVFFSIYENRLIISKRLLQMIGRIFNLFKEDSIKELVNKIINKKLEKDKIWILIQFIKKLEDLTLTDEIDKIRGLFGMLKILKMDKILNIYSQKEKIQFGLLENLSFNNCKKVVVAA